MTDYQLMNLQANATILLVAVISFAVGCVIVKMANKKIEQWDDNRPKIKERSNE